MYRITPFDELERNTLDLAAKTSLIGRLNGYPAANHYFWLATTQSEQVRCEQRWKQMEDEEGGSWG